MLANVCYLLTQSDGRPLRDMCGLAVAFACQQDALDALQQLRHEHPSAWSNVNVIPVGIGPRCADRARGR